MTEPVPFGGKQADSNAAGLPGPLEPPASQPAVADSAAGGRKRQRVEDRRSSPRFEVTAAVNLTIFAEVAAADGRSGEPETARLRITREGFTRDLSLSGACVQLDGRINGLPPQKVVGRKVKLRLELKQADAEELNLLGTIAWAQEQGNSCKLGVQFTEIPAAGMVILKRVCSQDEGEMNRLSNLWELLVGVPKSTEPPRTQS